MNPEPLTNKRVYVSHGSRNHVADESAYLSDIAAAVEWLKAEDANYARYWAGVIDPLDPGDAKNRKNEYRRWQQDGDGPFAEWCVWRMYDDITKARCAAFPCLKKKEAGK